MAATPSTGGHALNNQPSQLSLPAPAKLNLMLHILGRRPDGYHELQTLFQFLDYGDQLHFSLRQDGQIKLHDNLPGVPQDSNLIVRAARLLQQSSQSQLGVDIRIDKRLPMGGGLGGGSSNAATTLVGLNYLWGCELSLEQLAALSLQLGADVPVFVHGRAAFAEGVGEKLSFVELPEQWFVVACPEVSISTAKIFSDPGLTRNTAPCKVRSVLRQDGHNDCQATVERHYPQVTQALELLGQYANARLTGTGSCIFGGLQSQNEAAKVAAQISSKLECFIAKGCNHSGLHQALDSYRTGTTQPYE